MQIAATATQRDTHIRHAIPLKERETLKTVVCAGKGIDDAPRLI